MAGLAVTYGGAHYFDRTAALQSGEVEPRGIDLTYQTFASVGDLFRRMAQKADLEMAEMSLSTLIMMIAQGDDRLVGLPVFPSRAFRHRQIYVYRGSGIMVPTDLAGRRIGIPEYQMTAAVWIRAFLQDDYGVKPRDIAWLTGGLRSPVEHPRMSHAVPDGVSLTRIPPDSTLESLLEAGELSGLISTDAPMAFNTPDSRIQRLFANYRDVELDYYLRTGYFPIMHTVVIRRDIYDNNPWMVHPLLDAFELSKEVGYRRLREQHTLAVTHPWIEHELEQLQGIFKGDSFAYGIEPNRTILEAVLEYSVGQGLSPRLVAIEELFAAESFSWSSATDS